jgi:riboflavin biosynthesis pyrimidine reductase
MTEYEVQFDLKGYELFPSDMEWPDSVPAEPEPVNRPKTPSRFQFVCLADGVTLPKVNRPPKLRTYNAHQAVEFAKTEGDVFSFVEALYTAYWEHGLDINEIPVLVQIAQNYVKDVPGMLRAIQERHFADRIVDFDEPAYASGVYNVPTYFIGGERLAEQPYSVVASKLANVATKKLPYADLTFSNPHAARPFTFINMVTTIDGKIITGERSEPVGDLGSSTDHAIMHLLESKADAVLVGGESLRATGKNWNPKTKSRVVVTKTGNVPWDSEFLTHGEPIVLTTEDADFVVPSGITVLRAGVETLDWIQAMGLLKSRGIEILNVLGGSEINGQILKLDLADELFLTLAPKLKLGSDIPTYAGAIPFSRSEVRNLKLVESHIIGYETFLRLSLL